MLTTPSVPAASKKSKPAASLNGTSTPSPHPRFTHSHPPRRADLPAPEIAKDYWRLGPDAKFLDVIYAVRSDESTHRFVNHSLANLKYESDVNPFALREPGMDVKGTHIW